MRRSDYEPRRVPVRPVWLLLVWAIGVLGVYGLKMIEARSAAIASLGRWIGWH